jgi:hypothetical protein
MSWDQLLTPDPQEAQEPTWGDYAKAAGSGAASAAAGGASLLRELYSVGQGGAGARLWREVQGMAHQAGEDIEGSMTEEGRKRFGAAINSPEFWEHPFSSTLLKITGQAPYFAASVLPGGIISSTAGRLAAGAAVGGALSAGDVTDEITHAVDQASDEELKKQSTAYRGFRADMSEQDAKEELNKQILGMKPAAAFLLGMGTGLYGPAGNIIKRLGAGETKDVLKAARKAGEAQIAKAGGLAEEHGAAAAALEGIVTEGAEETYGAVAAQKAEKQRGAREQYDPSEIFRRGAEGSLIGGVLGGVSGIGAGGKGKGKAREAIDTGVGEEEPAIQTAAEVAQAGAAAAGVPATPAKTKAAEKGVEVVGPLTPNAAETAALAEPAQPTKPSPEQAVPPTPVQSPVQPPVQPPAAAPTTVPPQMTAGVAPTQQAPALPPGAAAPAPSQGVVPPVSTPAAEAGPPTDISARARTAVTPEVTAPVQQAGRVPPETPVETPPAGKVAELAPEPSVAPTQEAVGPRVLRDVSAEGRLREKEQLAAQQAAEKAAKQPGATEREPGSKKLTPAERASQAERAAHAERIFGRDREALTMPETPEARRRMALTLQSVLDEAKAAGLELREDLPQNIRDYFSKTKTGIKLTPEEIHRYHTSIPTKVGDKAMSPHVRFLREVAAVQKVLLESKKFGPKSRDRARVAQFIAEHNAKDLESLAARRKEEGDLAMRRQQRNVEAIAEGGVQTKGKVITVESEGAAGAPTTLAEMGPNARAAALAEAQESLKRAEARQTPKAQQIVEKAKAREEAAKPEAKPKTKTKPPSVQAAVERAEARAAKTKAKAEPTPKAQEILKKAKKEPEVVREVREEKPPEPESKEPAHDKPESETKAEQTKPESAKEEVTPEVTPEVTETTKEIVAALDEEEEAPVADTEAVKQARRREELIRKQQEKEEAKEAAEHEAAIAERAKAAAERAAAKPKPTADQVKAAIAQLKARKQETSVKAMPKPGEVTAEQKLQDYLDEPEVSAEQEADILQELERLGMTEKRPYRPQVVLEGDEHNRYPTPLHKARDQFGHGPHAISQTGTLEEALNALDLEHLPSVPKYLQGFTKRRLAELVGKIKVYVADEKLITDALGDDVPFVPGGYYHPESGAHGAHYIVLNSDVVSGDMAARAHVVMHEAMHAALFHHIEKSFAFRDSLNAMRDFLDVATKGSNEKVRRIVDYATTDAHEFVSEVMSNSRLQRLMKRMEVPQSILDQFGIPADKPKTLWGSFVAKVREMLGLPPGLKTNNFLENALSVIGPQIQKVRNTQIRTGDPMTGGVILRGPRPVQALSMAAVRSAAERQVGDTGINLRGKLKRTADLVSQTWQMARRSVDLFGPSNPTNRLAGERAKQEGTKNKVLREHGGDELPFALAQAQREHPEAYARANEIAFEASLHDIDLTGPNTHLGKDKLMGHQAKGEVARLQSAWRSPALDPVRATFEQQFEHSKALHNTVSRETLKNLLEESNIRDPALVDAIHESGLTDEHKTWMDKDLVRSIDELSALKRKQGSYIPFRRYGEFISAAEHELSVPSNAIRVGEAGNTLQFVDPTGKGGNSRARAQVKQYLRQSSHTPQGNQLVPLQIRKVWVDKNNPSNIVEAENVDAIPAYRVTMQTQHVEFHETEADAARHKAELADAGLRNARTNKRDEAYKNEREITGAMGTILRSLEKQQRYRDADSAQKLAMREMFADLSRGLSGLTSIKSSMKQRRNVAGMSRDLPRITADYARMTANHIAKLRHRPEIDKVFAEMRRYAEEHKHDKDAIRRKEVYDEFIDRIYGKSAAIAEEHKPGVISRLLQLTSISRLAGPSFHIVNAHEPWTTSLPVIGGRHGFVKTARKLAEAYNLIGGRAAVASGLRDTVKAYTSDIGFTDYPKLFKDMISKSKTLGANKASRLNDAIDYMTDRNLFGGESLFEVSRYAAAEGNLAGRALDRVDMMARQVGTAIEAINRTVTGLAAYDLEYKKNGGNHEAAMHYAYSTAINTMGDYSNWNAAPIFNTPAGRLVFQFKKFGQKTYYLLGNVLGGAMRGDPEAIKQFTGLMVTHGMVAGVLGLPTEPFKVALLAANALGVTAFTPEDYDYAVRQLAARLAGQKGGEIISKGLYRGIGIDTSSRFGLDSLFTFGQPKSQKDNDIKAYLFNTMAGAPAGYLLDQVQAAQLMFKGDVAGAIEKASPIRSVGDITKAVTGAMDVKKTEAGTTKQEQFTPWEAGVRALGFTPARASEMGALRGTVARESRAVSAERTELMRKWAEASGGKKVEAQRAVQTFNSRHPPDEQITQRDLTNAAHRRDTQKTKEQHGVQVTKRTKDIYERAAGVFNP